MPKLLLTKRNIDSKKHIPPVDKGQVDYFDEELKGLVLRVGKLSKVVYVQVDVSDDVTGKFKTVKEKIGAYGVFTNRISTDNCNNIISVTYVEVTWK